MIFQELDECNNLIWDTLFEVEATTVLTVRDMILCTFV